MNTLAVALLMLASAMSTAYALLQVLSSPTQRLPYIDNRPMSDGGGRKWLFLGAIVLIAVGSFVYSQRSDGNQILDFVVFLIVGVVPVVLIRFVHNRRVPESK
ncbi:hypothetical protein Arth_0460 [Arthrobacter sp. FB24]|uniref:hypothetical protein n=1 Tax=Arthrobacter sp. (strain FB24) TaxID=290399 RepID=UPI00005271C1|nr:hypothetical protein [Arthrobacter sp. FB24]ABK01860.1 hypothetical protein Arth_0460 [Arthrobacter sp. FB24]